MMARVNFVITIFFLFTVALRLTCSYPDYVSYIPNGNRIPHPCDRSITWPAVGHRNPSGSGRTTPFGEDFLGRWTQEICRADSDGDGRTNGEELGDPDCVWDRSSVPAITDRQQLSHPGVCEPLDSPICEGKNDFLPEECLKRFSTRKEFGDNNLEVTDEERPWKNNDL